MATSRIPAQPDLPVVGIPDYDQELSRKLYDIFIRLYQKLQGEFADIAAYQQKL